MRAAAFALAGLAACGRPDLTPTWAYDPIVLSGVDGEPDAAIGFQTWQLYGPKWSKRYKDKHYVCSVLVQLDAAALPDCDAPDCAVGWETTPTVLETDCADAALADEPLFVALRRLALGGAYVDDDAPWPGGTTTSHADYGDGWQVHGWAYPEVLDQGDVADPDWTGDEPFLFTPRAAFPL